MNDLSFALVRESFLVILDNSFPHSLTLLVRFSEFSYIKFISYLLNFIFSLSLPP